MTVDATGTPTSPDNIPTYATSADAPSGKGFNAAMAAIQTALSGRVLKNIVTTAGDLLYATGASTLARLGIGSNGQVLTVAGGLPTWATPSTSGGITDYFDLHHNANTPIPTGTYTTPVWADELADSGNFHTAGNDFVTLTAGIWLLGAQCEISTSAVGLRYSQFLVNGTVAYASETKTPVSGDVTSMEMVTMLAVGGGGLTIKPRWLQTSGGGLQLNALNYWSPRFWGFRFA